MPRRTLISLRRFVRMPLSEKGDEYSVWVGLVYIFNLIVGTGALALPAAFAKAGWGLGGGSILFLAFMSFMTSTFVIETMANANAILKWKKIQALKKESLDAEEEMEDDLLEQTDGEQPLVPYAAPSRFYSLDNRVELGEMANLFFNRTGKTLFYIVMCVYLYGDLSIYATVIAESIRDVVCTNVPINTTNETNELPCFKTDDDYVTDDTLTRFKCYRIALLNFICCMWPFVFFNVQKTKYLQIATTAMRWCAFAIMITMAVHLIISKGVQGNPPTANVKGLPTLFGTCVYSFMCHHSLPGLISPIRNKKHISRHLAMDYIVISLFYLLLACTGAFAFANLQDLYSLNFVPKNNDNIFLEIIEYFLALFPVFTLSTSFPIIAITLRNNLQSLCLDMTQFEKYNFFLRKLLFPIVTVLPPLLLTLFVEDLSILINFTGAYAGTCIQYLIPTFLVFSSRKYCTALLGLGVVNPFKSFFHSIAWGIFVFIWAVFCVVLVALHMIEKKS